MRIKAAQNLIDFIRRKRKTLEKNIYKNNNIQIVKSSRKKIDLNIDGKNNTIIIKAENIKGNISIKIYGDNNSVIIDENVYISCNLNILAGQNHPYFGKIYNSNFHIGKNTSIESLNYITFNSNVFCDIGENCMISYNVTLYNTDGHPIFDKNTKKIINKVKGIKIGKHCWIGANATILKNSSLPDDSILGYNSTFKGGGGTEQLRLCG